MVLFFYKAGLHYYRQTPVQRKAYTVSCGFLKHDEEDQVSDSEMEAEDAKWKSIAGLALMNVYDPEKQSTKFDYLLLVAELLYSVLSVCQTFRVYGGLLEKHFLFTSLILCLIMSKKVLISSHSH